MGLLDFLFPKYCINCRKIGDYICPDCFSYISFNVFDVCLNCNRQSIDGLTHKQCKRRFGTDGAFSAVEYKGVVRKLIYNFKYEPQFVSNLKIFLTDLFYESLVQKEGFMEIYEKYKNKLILVPIPLHNSKLRKRGYNQSELLAKELSKKLDLPTLSLLTRIKNTKSQFGLDKKERAKNIIGAFEISNNYQFSREARSSSAGQISNFKYNSILLVDDILTTGSTLKEAAKVLKINGAKNVWGITFARD